MWWCHICVKVDFGSLNSWNTLNLYVFTRNNGIYMYLRCLLSLHSIVYIGRIQEQNSIIYLYYINICYMCLLVFFHFIFSRSVYHFGKYIVFYRWYLYIFIPSFLCFRLFHDIFFSKRNLSIVSHRKRLSNWLRCTTANLIISMNFDEKKNTILVSSDTW